MMRAAVLREFSQPLRVESIDQPVPRSGESLVRSRAVGICGTDLKAWSGALPSFELPRVLGHEVAGEVVGGEDLEPGTRVAIYVYDSCGTCRACQSGFQTLCARAVRVGLERDGGLAEYVVVPSKLLIPLAPETPFDHAAVAMDAVATAWAALLGRGELEAGDSLLVVGVGGLGLNAVQVARAVGARVAALDVDPVKIELAGQLGADLAVLPAEIDEILDWSNGGVDLVLEVSGSREGFLVGAGAARPGGTIVCCGYKPGTEYGLDSIDLVLKQLAIKGSRAATLEQVKAALAAVERGDVLPRIDRHLALDEAQEAVDQLAAGTVVGRTVVEV